MRNLASLAAAPTLPSLLCYDALMLQVHDQMMIDMFLRPLLLLLLVFLIYCCFIGLFFAKSPLSSPRLCFADDEIVQVHILYGI